MYNISTITTEEADKAVLSVISSPSFFVNSPEGKEALSVALYNAPQASCPVIHRFGPGIYIREAHYSKGTLVVGHEHVHEHTNILLRGKIVIVDTDGRPQQLEAPYMFVAKPGRKVGYVLEDVVWQNIYSTTETDIETLEKTLFIQSESWEEVVNKKLEKERFEHEEDRKDFFNMLSETGWTEEVVSSISSYRGDCIPFPYGTYPLCPSPSPIHGKGLFATAPVPPGVCIAPMRLDGKRTPAGYLVNHSKTPNTEAILLPNEDIVLKTIRDIKGMEGGFLGEELTLDYRQIMKINNLWDGVKKCLPQ